MIDFIFLFITSYLIYCDASKLKEYSERLYEEEIKFSPAGMAVASFLIFIVFAPLYIFKRKKYLDKARIYDEVEKKIEDDVVLKATGNLMLVLILYLISSAVLTIIFLSIAYSVPSFNDPLFQGVILGIILNSIFVYFIYYSLKNKENEDVLKYLHIKKTSNPVLISFIFPVIGALIFAISNILVSTSYFSSFSSSSPLSNALFQSTATGMVTFMLFATLVAPLLEEIIFRGYLFTTVKRIKSEYFTVLFVALLFGFMHVDQNMGDPVAILLVFMVGLYITLLRFYTKSIIPCIAAHYAYNIAILLLPTVYMSIYYPSYVQFMKNNNSIRFEQKEDLLLKSIQDHPKFADAYNALAWTYAENGKRLDQGLFMINKALELRPGNLQYLDTKAEILYKMKRYDEAIEIEKSVVEKAPNFEFFKSQLEKFKKAKEAEKRSDNPSPPP